MKQSGVYGHTILKAAKVGRAFDEAMLKRRYTNIYI